MHYTMIPWNKGFSKRKECVSQEQIFAVDLNGQGGQNILDRPASFASVSSLLDEYIEASFDGYFHSSKLWLQ